MKLKLSRKFTITLCFALLGLSVSCSKDETEESSTAVQTLSEQVQGDWKLLQCNETYSTYEIGGLWKFFINSDSPIGEVWINGVHKFHYITTGDMIRIYNDATSDGYYRYKVVFANSGNTMRLMKLDSDVLGFEFSKI